MTWYLVIMLYRGGVDHVPQISKEQCLQNAKFAYSKSVSNYDKFICIQGK